MIVSTLIVAFVALPALVVSASEATSSSALADTASWGLLVGIFTPMLVSVVQQPKWTKRTRSIVAVAASVVVGLLTSLANGLLSNNDQTPRSVLSTIALVLVASQGSYQLFKTSGVSAKIENATSGTPKMPDPGDQPGYVEDGVVSDVNVDEARQDQADAATTAALAQARQAQAAAQGPDVVVDDEVAPRSPDVP